jgi:hypothetical protein
MGMVCASAANRRRGTMLVVRAFKLERWVKEGILMLVGQSIVIVFKVFKFFN